MGVVLESDSDDEEDKKIVEKEEEESEVRFCPPADFTLCQFYSLSALLTHSSSSSLFTFVSRRTSFLSLRFEPPMMALTAHSHTLSFSLFLDHHPGGSRKHGRRRRRRRRTTKEKEAKERQNEEEKEERR